VTFWLVMAPGRVFFDSSFFQLDSDHSAFVHLVAALTTLPTDYNLLITSQCFGAAFRQFYIVKKSG
jgi:hypothetical protein